MEISIEILNDKVVALLHDLEDLQLIKLINLPKRKEKTIVKNRFSGRISKESAMELNNQLIEMRSEWQTRNSQSA
jgi:hypothetical protein